MNSTFKTASTSSKIILSGNVLSIDLHSVWSAKNEDIMNFTFKTAKPSCQTASSVQTRYWSSCQLIKNDEIMHLTFNFKIASTNRVPHYEWINEWMNKSEWMNERMNEWMKWLLIYRLSSGQWLNLKVVYSTCLTLTSGLPTWVEQSKDT